MAKLKHLSRDTVIEYFEDHMTEDEYDFSGMYYLYMELMGRPNVYGIYKPMQKRTLQSLLHELGNKEDSFLIAKNKGKGCKVIYLKKVDPLPTIKDYLDDIGLCDKVKMSPLYERANRIYKAGSKLWRNR